MHQVLELQQLAGIIGMPGNRTAMFDKIKNVCNVNNLRIRCLAISDKMSPFASAYNTIIVKNQDDDLPLHYIVIIVSCGDKVRDDRRKEVNE